MILLVQTLHFLGDSKATGRYSDLIKDIDDS